MNASAPTITVLHASALDFDAAFFSKFDALITDPPYSPRVHENCASVGTQGAGSMGAHARDLQFAPLSERLRGAIAIAAASVRRWSAVFSDWQGGHAWDSFADARGAEAIRWVPWVRWSQPQLSGDRPCTGSEAVLLYHAQGAPNSRGTRAPIKKHWNGPGSLTHFGSPCECAACMLPFLEGLRARALRGQDKHPTEKPLDLLLDLVSWLSDPGDNVLDPCAGAGTTAQACRLLGRSCVAIELDEAWAATAGQRVSGSLAGTRDAVRAQEWVERTITEASSVPEPRAANGSDVKTWERAQRRMEDAARVAEAIG